MSSNNGTLEINVLPPLHQIYTCNYAHYYSSSIIALFLGPYAWAE